MKRLIYPIMLITVSLVAAAMVTTVLAKTLASYYHNEVGPKTEMASR